jgi:hypothetical protein
MELENLKQIPDSFWNLASLDNNSPTKEASLTGVDLSRAGKINITRDTYLEAQARGLSLTELLESDDYDPSPVNAPLDAFERQLAVHGIRVNGRTPDTVESFYRAAASLMPEFVMREVRKGMAMRPLYNQLTAAQTVIGSNRYSPLYLNISPTDTRLSLRPIGEGAEIPQFVVNEQKKTVTVPEYGIALKVSYRTLRHRTLTQFKVLLWYLGFRLQTDKVALLAEVLQSGDGNTNPATVINTDVSGTLDYDDLVKFWAEFAPFELNTILCEKTKMRQILTLTEFKDPLAGFKFPSTGELVSPLGAKLIRCDTVPTDTIIGLDSRFAVEEVISQPLTVEYDRIIEQRFEEAVISESVAFAKVIKEASLVLDDTF